MDDLQVIIDRVKAGSRDRDDIEAIANAISDRKLILSNFIKGVIIDDSHITDSQVIPGDQNVVGNQNVIIQIDGTTAQILQSIPSLQTLFSQTFNITQSEVLPCIDELVKLVRQRIKPDVQERCGTMRVLDMTQPIGLSDIYTDVNILEKISGRRWINFSELIQDFDPESENFDRYGLCRISETRVLGIDAVKKHPRLMVLGKPGAGKTTFLKYLAIQCITGSFQTGRIPIFITLKQFSEDPDKPDFLTFIYRLCAKLEIPDYHVKFLLKSGRFLILLDGLDEVSEEESTRIVNQIREFTENHFFSNLFYADLDQFTRKIIKKFRSMSWSSKNKSKIIYSAWLKKEFPGSSPLLNKIIRIFEEFATKVSKGILKIEIDIDHEKLIREFSGKLDEIPQYEYLNYFREKDSISTYNNYFIVTCRIAAREEKFEHFTEVEVADFDDNQIKVFIDKWFRDKTTGSSQAFISQMESVHRIKELATNPLLLTLLCLVFQETFDFPLNRSELYKEGVNILIKKWDAERLIRRDNGYEIYRKLSASRKEDLLSHISFTTFERKEYFFKQRDIEIYISKYIMNLPDFQLSSESLQLDSESVLKSIESQHGLLIERARGIYSFSHLTFQEYFTARKIATQTSPKILENSLQDLASRISEKRWREVLLLTIEMLPDADRLFQLLKKKADLILLNCEELQNLLSWIDQKSLEVKSPYKIVSVRAFYLTHVYNLLCFDKSIQIVDNKLSCSLDSLLNQELLSDAHEFSRKIYEAQRRAFPHRNDPEFVLIVASVQVDVFNLLFNNHTRESLIFLKDQIPIRFGKNKFESWWIANSRTWTLQFKLLIQHVNFGHEWKLDANKMLLLKQYHDANLLLADCLKGDCYISRDVRRNIEETLLLPIAEIEKRKNQSVD